MKDIINNKDTKPVRGFATVELFDKLGKKILKEKTENTLTYLEANRIKWRVKQDFCVGIPSNSLSEPPFMLNNIVLDSSNKEVSPNSPIKNIGTVIGWSDKTEYSGTDTKRGSLNPSRSYAVDGYARWSFYWLPHSGNGTFQSIIWSFSGGTIYTSTYTSFFAPDPHPTGIVWDGNGFWVSALNSNKIFKIAPYPSQLLPNRAIAIDEISAPDPNCMALAWDGTNLWAAGYDTQRIYKINPNVYQGVITSFPSPGSAPYGLTWDGTNLLIADITDRFRIFKVNPQNGSIISSFVSPTYTRNITWDGENIWAVASFAAPRHAYKMNPSNGDIITYLNIPDDDPWGISWDGTNLLVTGRSSNKIYRLGAAIGAVTRLSNPITKTDANVMRVTYDFVFQD